MTLDELRLFVALAEEGSLTAAGRRVGLGPGGASAALRRIEARARVRLVERSTRSIRLTPEGERFLATCEEMLAVWERGELALQEAREGLAGVLRVTAPIDLAEQYVADWIAAFVASHPEVRVTLLTGDAMLRIPADDIDVAIRYGTTPEVNQVVRRLASARRVLVASPAYLDRAGRPDVPADLGAHRCLAWLRGDRPFARWPLTDGDTEWTHAFAPTLCADGGLVRRWAVRGEGIAYKGSIDVLEDLRTGRLERVLPGWHGEALPLVAVTPGRRHRVARVQALIDTFAARVKDLTQAAELRQRRGRPLREAAIWIRSQRPGDAAWTPPASTNPCRPSVPSTCSRWASGPPAPTPWGLGASCSASSGRCAARVWWSPAAACGSICWAAWPSPAGATPPTRPSAWRCWAWSPRRCRWTRSPT